MESAENLIRWNRQGLIPGPKESDADFLERACKAKIENPPKELAAAFAKVASRFDVCPTWIPIRYDSTGLAPWHGGVMEPGSGLQLRGAFKNRERYLGLYSRTEVAAHELVHAGRFGFDEPQFEELFAYEMSSSFLRRWLGPIVVRPLEVWLFLASILLPLVGDYLCLIFGWWEGFSLLLPLKVLPGLLISYGIIRMIRKRGVLRRVAKRLALVTGCEKKARASLFRLSDEEIRQFSKMDAHKIQRTLETKPGIRFEMIRLAYGFSHSSISDA